MVDVGHSIARTDGTKVCVAHFNACADGCGGCTRSLQRLHPATPVVAPMTPVVPTARDNSCIADPYARIADPYARIARSYRRADDRSGQRRPLIRRPPPTRGGG